MKRYICTVITIVYNDAPAIKDTIESVIGQEFDDYEYVIIDGGSNDGTRQIIDKYSNVVNTIISENDNGIYDAMNKGVNVANGEWLIFMNSGDCFYDNSVLKHVFEKNVSDFDMLIGGAIAKSSWQEIYLPSRTPFNVWKSFTHQSIFAKRIEGVDFYFDEKYSCASDFDFVYRYFIAGRYIKTISETISCVRYEDKGHSAKFSIKSKIDVLTSILRNFSYSRGSTSHFIYHFYKLFLNCCSVCISRISPKLIYQLRTLRDRNKVIK